MFFIIFFFKVTSTAKIYTLSLHDALPISQRSIVCSPSSSTSGSIIGTIEAAWHAAARSEEHTSELQSLTNIVCRLLLEKKKVMAAQQQSNSSSQNTNSSSTYSPLKAIFNN